MISEQQAAARKEQQRQQVKGWREGSSRQAGGVRGTWGAEEPTCYLLKVHIQFKLSRDGGAVLVAGLPAVAAARSQSRRGAAQAHVAELHVLGEEEPAVCGDGTHSQPGSVSMSHGQFNAFIGFIIYTSS